MVANSGGKNALRAYAFLERYLARACETMSNLPPVNQVATVKDGHTWKIFASGGDKIIILTNSTDTGVRVKAGNYRIAVHTHSLSFFYPLFLLKEFNVLQEGKVLASCTRLEHALPI